MLVNKEALAEVLDKQMTLVNRAVLEDALGKQVALFNREALAEGLRKQTNGASSQIGTSRGVS